MGLVGEILNISPSPHDKARRTSKQILSKTATNINTKHFKPFGRRTYILALVYYKKHFKNGGKEPK